LKITSAYIEITNRCNLDCATCYNRSGKNVVPVELSVGDISTMLDTLIGVFDCDSFYFAGGEPTLHSHFDDLMDMTERYPGRTFGIITNGTVHKEKMISLFRSRSDFQIQVSLDGSCEEINARIRGKGSFEKTAGLIKKLSGGSKRPRVKMVISQSNLDDIEAFYKTAVELGAVPEFSFVYKSGGAALTGRHGGLRPG
jgi:MoaA/NifB/PqqE/SkfB family radical SAM enzyme